MLDRTKTKILRCAIYTRKSSEEGLEQDFNSLHAQREACEAYVSSQRHEGWTALSETYDDGGFSGGSMERPALRKLLDDINDRKVDVVVVYKVDRLTRSLADFAKIVEVFDGRGVSFVSVTQQFNTTSSMGRLTLNVLLSFAQFEREVTGERIRDKIAASKKKGMWMGGWVAIGYDRKDRTLVINEAEAETVRTIFRLYLELKNVRLVEAELKRLNLRTKAYIAARGRAIGNRPFSRGHLYKILSCPLYVGEIAHQGHRYPAQHPPIIDPVMWDAVQTQLQTNSHEHRSKSNSKEISLLAGLLFDAKGNRFVATHTSKGSKRYRYYALQVDGKRPADRQRPSLRIPAPDIEAITTQELSDFLTDRQRVLSTLQLTTAASAQLSGALSRASELASQLRDGDAIASRSVIERMVRRVSVAQSMIRIELEQKFLLGDAVPLSARGDQPIILETKFDFVRRVGKTKIIVQGSEQSEQWPAIALIKAIARGHFWFNELLSGKAASMREVAATEGITERYVAQQMQLALLAPTLVQSFLDGAITLAASAKRLSEHGVPINWSHQMQLARPRTRLVHDRFESLPLRQIIPTSR
jgi:DNA invertase Pin-like site-specific DNA recombinase